MPSLTYPVALKQVPEPWRGDPFDWTLGMAKGVAEDGTLIDPVDLTGFGSSWAATARAGGDSVELAVDATHATQGYVVLHLTGAQTAELQRGREYTFDVQASGGPRSPFTVWTGAFRPAGDYTP